MPATRFRVDRLPAPFRPLVTEAVAAAAAAGWLLCERFRTALTIERKGAADLVTQADLEAQRLIQQRIRRAFPAHGILSEEDLDLLPDAEWRWIVDPLDGTKNFAYGHPAFCVSIAVEHRGRVAVGVVCDPLHEEIFLGVRGQGAWCNGTPLAVSRAGRLDRAFLGTGLPNRAAPLAASLGRTFGRFAARSLGVRDRGAGALDLCYVACGRLDGYWEIDQSPWDVAAGSLIVAEAGGRLSDFRGRPFDLFGGQTVASNGRIHRQILEVLALPGGFPARYTPPLRRKGDDA
jgi:myo-inositol-1(or 4)-monophosphatase